LDYSLLNVGSVSGFPLIERAGSTISPVIKVTAPQVLAVSQEETPHGEGETAALKSLHVLLPSRPPSKHANSPVASVSFKFFL
jgi:hypothetical protein